MLERKCIMVVEDNEINRATLCGLLASEYQILEAENGQEALDILKEKKDDISLILLDIIMPVMDGYTFLSIVKKDADLSTIPIIVTTQSDSDADEVAALTHGAEDFVTKPYKAEILLNRVSSTIRFRETAAMINQFQYDRLTGLYSKTFFCQRTKELLGRYPEQEFDIICSDVENFKLINDVLGNKAGDDLLREIADCCRAYAGANGICGRLNSDRFVCLVERGRTYSDEVFLHLSKKIGLLSNNKSVDIKWGIYAIEERDLPVEQMCDRAMLAVQSIKGKYGCYYAIYNNSLRDRLLRQQAIIDSMESALKDGQFQVYFQPKYRIRDDQLAGAEALVRWTHPKWGMLSPAEFIPLFEKNGFITRLDQFVWEEVCRKLKAWEKRGYAHFPVSVNVSRADIYSVDIADLLISIVQKYDLAPERLHLEITESAYTENSIQLIEVVNRLRELGFIIEMDDFGSGYSSLNMLNQMPIDVLKLDMKFIQSETAKPLEHGILQFVIDLARRMHLSVVAEGVETREQLDRLLEVDCDYVQGYYFARPMSAEEFEKFLEKEKLRGKLGRIQYSNDEDQSEYHKQILFIADEDEPYIEQVRANFSALFHVIAAADVNVALNLVSEYSDRIALVLLSQSLSKDGAFAVLELFQHNRDLWKIPIIITGPADRDLEKKALEAGAVDYAAKPHWPESLTKRVTHAIRLNTSRMREEILREEAFRDPMTSALNRRGWLAAAETLHKADAPMAVCFFDLDNLKKINDIYGHGEGDRLIVEFSKVIRKNIRDTDIVARLGGDEFIVIMKRMQSPEIALKKCQEICNAFREAPIIEKMPATASAGIVMWNAECSLEDIVEKVDTALYHAKTTHDGQCVIL
jgi:diguanylate cyclase (GGDEF)-like protein